MQLHAAEAVLSLTAPAVAAGGVLVHEGRIVAVGKSDELRSHAEEIVRYDGILMPGFVNAHAHLQYGPSFADLVQLGVSAGHTFADWLLQMTERRKAMSDPGWRDEVAGSWEQARSTGTVAVADIVTSVAAFDVAVPGVRYLESVALPSAAWESEARRVDAVLTSHPEAGISPHTLYTLGSGVITGLTKLARERGRRIHPHLAETVDEDEFIRAGTGPFAAWPFAAEIRDAQGAGCSPAQHLDALGGLGADVHVAHGTHLDAADRQLLRERGTPVALCARSNSLLGSGAPPVAALLREQSPIAVGTDSLASTPDLDMLAEVRALAVIAISQGYDDADLGLRLLFAATRGGAAAIGRSDLGRLETGAVAAFAHVLVDDPAAEDLVAEVLRSGAGQPAGDPLSAQQADSTL